MAAIPAVPIDRTRVNGSGNGGAIHFEPGSFHDPDARVFRVGDRVCRVLSARAAGNWRMLSATGFFQRRTAAGSVVATRELDEAERAVIGLDGLEAWPVVLEHRPVVYQSYPCEWCFGMLREAALLHLDLMRDALDEGMVLKDATPYNILWHGLSPTFIDIPSFVEYRSGLPWMGYRQFCQLFLYPLMLTAYRRVDFQPWLKGSTNGIPVAQMSGLLGGAARFRKGVMSHVVLAARLERRPPVHRREILGELQTAGFGEALIRSNVDRMHRLVSALERPRIESPWRHYDPLPLYPGESLALKESFVSEQSRRLGPRTVLDLGSGSGRFSTIAAANAGLVVAMDQDAGAVEAMYQALRGKGPRNVLPLVGDIADSSGQRGRQPYEHRSLPGLGYYDLVLALALVHHVVFSVGIPLREFLHWLNALGRHAIVEFVDADDDSVVELRARMADGHHPYDRPLFEHIIGEMFVVEASLQLPGTGRTLYHLHSKRPAAES